MRTSTIKQDILIERLGNGIFVKSNTKRFTEFTNCNLSRRLGELTLLFFNDVEEHGFPLNCTYQIVTQTEGYVFLYNHPSFTAAYSLKSEKDWPVGFAKL